MLLEPLIDELLNVTLCCVAPLNVHVTVVPTVTVVDAGSKKLSPTEMLFDVLPVPPPPPPPPPPVLLGAAVFSPPPPQAMSANASVVKVQRSARIPTP